MERLKYINTFEVQSRFYYFRNANRIRIVINQTPKSKNHISDKEKLKYQEGILQYLLKYKRRAFKSPIILKITFNSRLDNPPAIHNLAKNYLDLLEKPIKGLKTKRNSLIYNNDRQVKILIVEYNFIEKGKDESIYIIADSINNFLKDLNFLKKIEFCDFSNKDELHYDIYDFKENDTNNSEYSNELNDFIKNKSVYKKIFNDKIYNNILDIYIKQAQEYILNSLEFKIEQFYSIFNTNNYINKIESNKIVNNILTETRNFVISNIKWFSVDIGVIPQKSGDTNELKRKIKRVLNSYIKEKSNILFPLRSLLNITILLLTPKGKGIDLDNLAKIIIPFVNSIIKPPSTYFNTIDLDLIEDENIKLRYIEENNRLGKIPKYSITGFQIIEIPRDNNDPKEGFIKLLLGNGLKNNNIWLELDKKLDLWIKYIDDRI